jgi:hypothetical protein
MADNSVQYGKLRGNIRSLLTLSGNICSKGSLNGVISKPQYVNHEKYQGDYEVTPKVEAQTLPTKDKVLIDDMTIKAIPFYNVSNTSGGNTVYIGSEV